MSQKLPVFVPPIRYLGGVQGHNYIPTPENINKNYIEVPQARYGCQSCKDAMKAGDWLAPIKAHPILVVGAVVAIIAAFIYIKRRNK